MWKLFAFVLCLSNEAQAGLNTSCHQWPGGTQPVAAASLNYNCLRFDPSFRTSNQIDATDTGNATKDLFVHNTFPTAPAQGTGWDFVSIPSTPQADWSIDAANGLLVIAPTGGTNYGGLPVQMMTCRYSATAPTNYMGQTFGPGYYVDVKSSISFTAPSSGTWDIWWSVGLQMLTGAAGAPWHTAEFDNVEDTGGSGPAQPYHDWDGVGTTANWIDGLNTAGGTGGGAAGLFYRLGISVQPAQFNDGITGFIKRWGGDVAGDTVSYTTTGPSSPATTGAHNGNFSSLNTQKDCLAFASGAGQYHKIELMRVWTR